MEQFNKVLIRTSLTDEGTELPRTGILSDSPDVIPHGTTKVADPQEFFILNYDANVGTELLATQKNYIYMRGKDVVTGLVKADLYVYYAKDVDLNTPKKWVNNLLKTSAGKNFNTVIGQNEGNILVGADAYEWTPPDPLAGETYSLIGVAVPSGTVPSFTGIKDFEDLVANNLNVGWRSVIIKKPPPPPTPTLRWETTFNYDEGAVTRDMNFEISCKNIPIGSMVAFRSDNASGPEPPILLNKTTVNEPNAHIGIESTVPAGYKGNITFSFYCKDTPPAGSAITFRSFYFDTAGSGPQKPIVVTSVTTTN